MAGCAGAPRGSDRLIAQSRETSGIEPYKPLSLKFPGRTCYVQEDSSRSSRTALAWKHQHGGTWTPAFAPGCFRYRANNQPVTVSGVAATSITVFFHFDPWRRRAAPIPRSPRLSRARTEGMGTVAGTVGSTPAGSPGSSRKKLSRPSPTALLKGSLVKENHKISSNKSLLSEIVINGSVPAPNPQLSGVTEKISAAFEELTQVNSLPSEELPPIAVLVDTRKPPKSNVVPSNFETLISETSP